jgi:hypothetical protein
MAPPAPVAPVGAAVTSTMPAPPTAEQQFFAPAVLQPVVQLPPTAPTVRSGASSGYGPGGGAGKWLALAGIVGFVIAAVATAWFTFGGSSSQPAPAVALAPRAPTAGLPTSLPAIVRIQAESSRRTALQAVEQVGRGDPTALADARPDFVWLAGDRASTGAHEVSVAQNAGVVTIAVSASSRDVCAFGQWWPGGTPQYVTMAHEPSCAAVAAPSTGWSTEAGGAASDLPDDNG